MAWPRGWDVKALDFGTQLTLATVATSATALILATSVLLSQEILHSRRTAEADLELLAELVGKNSTSALVFGDARVAREHLDALAGRSNVVAARLYLANGWPLADYRAPGANVVLPPVAGAPALRLENGDYVLSHRVLVSGEHAGDLYVRASRDQMMAHIRSYAATVGGALFAAVIAGVLVASRLHGLISRPILALTSAAHRVSEHSDYSVRVPEPASGELSTLTSAFNRMLQRIEEQDRALRGVRDELETRVRERVQELRREVMERRGVEAALRASQAQLQSVVENSSNLFYSHSPNHKVAYVSPQSRAFLDCEPADAPVTWTDWLTEDPVNLAGLEAREIAIRTGQRQPPFELELRTCNGRHVRVEVNEVPVVQAGRTVMIVGAFTDITDRKRVESEKTRLEEQLRQAQKMEAVGRLAGGVAHDFNNLLGVISGYGELLVRQIEPSSPYRKRVEQMLKATERATGLTRQLLAFSRKQVLDPKPLDLGTVVTDLEKMLERMIGEDIRLSLDVQSPLGIVRADPGQIEQVLMNLSVNARDAMPHGGSLRISLVDRHVGEEQSRVRPGRYVVLEVSDTGCGMDRETLSHIFEPFFTTKESGRGTGLGLATVYSIVQQSGGVIDVDSRRGVGTTFRLYFPRVEEAAARPAERPLAVSGGRETVLLVEDEGALRELVGEMLRDAGYSVLAAPGGAQALAVAQAHRGPIHLMLTDVVMPVMGGHEIAERLRAQRPATRVLYMSGYTDEVIRQRGHVGPAMALLQKPFTTAALLERVRQVLTGTARAGAETLALPVSQIA
jgi:PAS domain S-box-containing protein